MKNSTLKKFILFVAAIVTVITLCQNKASAATKVSQTQWYNIGAEWHYKENGQDIIGWKNISGEWYNFGNNGAMKTGWLEDNGIWYYFWSNGMMAHDSWLWNGQLWYYLDSNGKMVQDQTQVGTHTYYFTAPAMITTVELTGLPTTNESPSK